MINKIILSGILFASLFLFAPNLRAESMTISGYTETTATTYSCTNVACNFVPLPVDNMWLYMTRFETGYYFNPDGNYYYDLTITINSNYYELDISNSLKFYIRPTGGDFTEVKVYNVTKEITPLSNGAGNSTQLTFTFKTLEATSYDYFAVNINFTPTTFGDLSLDPSFSTTINFTKNSELNEMSDVQVEIQETNNKLNNIEDSMKDSDVTGAINSGNSFFDNFEDKDYGFSDIIKIPLETINQITSATCTPLKLPLPFVDTSVELPCMYAIYQTYFGSILTIYQTITFGMIAYYICIDLFRMVKNFKDPQNDEVGVMEL